MEPAPDAVPDCSATTAPLPHVHIVQLLIRDKVAKGVGFLVCPMPGWTDAKTGQPYLSLPTKKTVADSEAPSLHGESLEVFVNAVMEGQFGLEPDEFAIEQEMGSVRHRGPAVKSKVRKDFTLCPVDVWVRPDKRAALREQLGGQYLTCGEILKHPLGSPQLREVFGYLARLENELAQRDARDAAAAADEESLHRLMVSVPDRPSMYALARRWFNRNPGGVRHLPKAVLDDVLAAGEGAFELRVANPWLRYQLPGQGFAWSFFTHKEGQVIHIHSAPVVEVYGVIEGRLEIWSKPYYNRGTSAWSHEIVEAGGWIEVNALQCHFVHWLGAGKGVIFRAGTGLQAEAGRLGVGGQTPCDRCTCVKPPEVLKLLKSKK